MATITINVSDYKALTARVSKLESRMQDVLREKSGLGAENRKLRKKVAVISRDYQELSGKYKRLSKDHNKLSNKYEALVLKHQEAMSKSEVLGETVLSLRQQLFGKKKDRVKGKSAIAGYIKQKARTETLGDKRRGRRKMPEGYAADKTINYDFTSNPHCCDQEMSYMGSNDSHHTDYEIVFKKVKICHSKYVCRRCSNILTAKGSKLPIPKGLPLSGLLTKVILDKFSSATPFYRQAQNFGYEGIGYTRQLLNNWFGRAADLVEPVVNLMFEKMLGSNYLMCDETQVLLLDKNEGKDGKAHICVIKEAGKEFNFVYCWAIKDRTQKVIGEKVEKFRGHFQTDGLNFYVEVQKRGDVIAVNCWSHARRKFLDIAKLAGKSNGLAFQVVKRIDKLYAIEKQGKTLSDSELLALRQTKSAAILKELNKYLEKYLPTVPPKSKIAEAINYILTRWPALTAYLEDPKLEIDNNATERCIKYVVMGRKNWLFADNIDSAQKVSVLYSLIISCKFNNINPQEYMNYLFTQMPYINRHDKNEVEQLLPDRFNLNKKFDEEYRERLGIFDTVTTLLETEVQGSSAAAVAAA